MRLASYALGIALTTTVALSACAPTGSDARPKTTALAASKGFREHIIPTSRFDFYALERISSPVKSVRIFIEGDGNAWLTRSQPSPDPTPLKPTMLDIALEDSSANVIYLARPCQYVSGKHCNTGVWTGAQFAEQQIAAINDAINIYKGRPIELVGYSGGGAVAMLIAARRTDIASIRTIAGNINTSYFTTFHKVTPLSGSLNPWDQRLSNFRIPQIHFSGAQDKIVPPSLAEDYQSSLPAENCSRVMTVPGAEHASGWKEQWHTLSIQPLPCGN